MSFDRLKPAFDAVPGCAFVLRFDDEGRAARARKSRRRRFDARPYCSPNTRAKIVSTCLKW